MVVSSPSIGLVSRDFPTRRVAVLADATRLTTRRDHCGLWATEWAYNPVKTVSSRCDCAVEYSVTVSSLRLLGLQANLEIRAVK